LASVYFLFTLGINWRLMIVFASREVYIAMQVHMQLAE